MDVQFKGPANLVTEVDLASEEQIVQMLQATFPGYGIQAEEGHDHSAGDRPTWLIDPLDGTTNYAHGYPHFCTSIALQVDGYTQVGVVYQPITDELFVAENGKGAFLNGKPIRVSHVTSLDLALVASGFPYDAWEIDRDNTREWRRLTKTAQSVRCDGSAALNLCYVACGRLDAYWELDLEAWDMAAGALICQEAGGRVSLPDGESFDINRRCILATNGHLHEEMLSMLKG
jgi:myo-inositol-1(or 4)-monophosphatase